MKRFEASWFCHGEWQYFTIQLLAETPAEVEQFISDEYTKREYRSKVYKNKDEDSLVIKELETITFPYEVRL